MRAKLIMSIIRWMGEKYDGIRGLWNPKARTLYPPLSLLSPPSLFFIHLFCFCFVFYYFFALFIFDQRRYSRLGKQIDFPVAFKYLLPKIFLDGEIWSSPSHSSLPPCTYFKCLIYMTGLAGETTNMPKVYLIDKKRSRGKTCDCSLSISPTPPSTQTPSSTAFPLSSPPSPLTIPLLYPTLSSPLLTSFIYFDEKEMVVGMQKFSSSKPLRTLTRLVLDSGGEGTVARKCKSTYFCGRSTEFLKLKVRKRGWGRREDRCECGDKII